MEVNNNKIIDHEVGHFKTIMKDFPVRLLKAGTYSFDLFAGIIRTAPLQSIENAISFDIDVLEENNYDSIYSKDRQGIIGVNLDWVNQKIE
jgi:hypothetical protein